MCENGLSAAWQLEVQAIVLIVSVGLRARSWLLADLLGKRLECG